MISAGTLLALAAGGFRRWSTYRQATVAAAFTNSIFGFLRCSVLLTVAAGAGGVAAGYTGPMLATFVWVSQGLFGVVGLGGWWDLADRVRSGDVVTDLLRPVDPLVAYLAADLGRAGFAMLTRFVLPITVGALFFDLYRPDSAGTYPLFAASLLLATVTSFALRYLVNLTAFWLYDIRGVHTGWLFLSGALSGLLVPIPFLPPWLATAIWLGTPLPGLVQSPMDVLVERGGLGGQLVRLGVQLGWAALCFAACVLVQRRGVRRLVVQGG